MDINKHRYYLIKILKDIYSDPKLATNLGFKGGTALMFFYDLPRFSVDLDFNLIRKENEEKVFHKIREILLQYGSIHDEALKHFGPVLVLNYKAGGRKLKVEISNRQFGDRYEILNYLGINIKVMVSSDMFAHKLCALLDRKVMANRDIFDIWFLMDKQTPINPSIINERTGMSLDVYIQLCIDRLERMNNKGILQGLGELLDPKIKNFVRTKLLTETISLLKFYKKFPILD